MKIQITQIIKKYRHQCDEYEIVGSNDDIKKLKLVAT